MSLKFGREVLAIPGPSVMPDRVLAAMHRAAPNIYFGAMHDMVDSLIPDLCRVARHDGAVAIYIGNGHAAWEAAISNVFSRGDKALCLITGRFGEGWAGTAEAMGVVTERLDFGRYSGVDLDRVEQALRSDSGHQIKALVTVQTDTASTLRTDIKQLRDLLEMVGHPALLLVDAIASLGCDRLEMTDWGVDILVAASQKGLMTPPGMAFVWASERAMEAQKSADLVTPYWDIRPRTRGDEFYQKFCGTAPTHHLFGLREALTMLLDEEGLEAAWRRHATLAQATWAAVEGWSNGGPIALNVADPEQRAHSVTSVYLGGAEATRLRQWCEATAGLTLGIGLGMQTPEDPEADGYLRIAHMGHVNAHMLLGTLGAMEAGLAALKIPHGPGVAAATKVIAAYPD